MKWGLLMRVEIISVLGIATSVEKVEKWVRKEREAGKAHFQILVMLEL